MDKLNDDFDSLTNLLNNLASELDVEQAKFGSLAKKNSTKPVLVIDDPEFELSKPRESREDHDRKQDDTRVS